MEDLLRLNKRLEILRAAGAISDFTITQTPGRPLIEVAPGDSLEGEELYKFVCEMMGTDRDQIQLIVAALRK
jgi:hypothetical protein